MIIRILFFALISLIWTFLCWTCINWWAPLFANQAGYLPNWLAWVQTFDDSLDAGQRDGMYPDTWPKYLARMFWLYRNPGYGFGYWLLGVPFNPESWKVITYTPADANGKGFEFYAEGPNDLFNYHTTFGPIRIKLGWKAWNMFDVATATWKTTPWGPEWRIPFTCSITPTH